MNDNKIKQDKRNVKLNRFKEEWDEFGRHFIECMNKAFFKNRKFKRLMKKVTKELNKKEKDK